MKSFLVTVLILILFVKVDSQTLVINELSQGTSGTQEYIELLIVGTPSCSEEICLDIRGYIIDDNNGYFASGTGTGIATGAVRFADNPLWECLPLGTKVLIYNDGDINPEIPANDILLNDGNCNLVVPISSNLFETHTSLPNTNDSSYSTSDWQSGGSWNSIIMANTNDSFQIYAPDDLNTPVFGVSWGNNTNNNIIYFSGSTGGLVMYLDGDNYLDQNQWLTADAVTNQTAGNANSLGNAIWLDLLSNSCVTIDYLTVNASVTSTTCSSSCDGIIDLTVSGGQAPYQYLWSGGEDTEDLSNLCEGQYSVTVTDAAACVDVLTFDIAAGANLSQPNLLSNTEFCLNENGYLFVESTSNTVNWFSDDQGSNLLNTGDTLILQNTIEGTQTIYVQQEDNQGCLSDFLAVDVLVNPLPDVQFSVSDNQITEPGNIDLINNTQGNFTSEWLWNGLFVSSDLDYSILIEDEGIYVATLVITDENNCVDSTSSTIQYLIESFVIPDIFSPNADGYNDSFQIEGNGMTSLSVEIYNRWGQLIHIINGVNDSWDGLLKSGEPASEGTYFIVVNADFVTGEPINETKYITLLRE